MRLTLGEIASITASSTDAPNVVVTGLSVDSREVSPGDLFCAIRGAQQDGHDYVADAIRRGAVAALATRPISGYSVLVVRDVVQAMSLIAKNLRDSFEGPVIGITGSVGKTTVKELTAAALSKAFNVLKSEGNQNTEYGLPIAWSRVQPGQNCAVMEMAMRGRGQIADLCRFSRPTIGVVTRIGSSHIGELGSREAIAQAKGELIEALPSTGTAVLNIEDDFFPMLSRLAKCEVLTFGGQSADVAIVDYKTDFNQGLVHCTLFIRGEKVSLSVPGFGKAMAINAAAAMGVVVAVNADIYDAAQAIGHVQLPANRMTVVRVSCIVLADAYNSSPESCLAALQVLADYPSTGERIAILGDMLELGDYSEEAHRLVGKEIANLGIDRLAVIGRDSHWIREEALANGYQGRVDVLSNIEDVAEILQGLSADDVALVKASRGLALERAIELAGAQSA